MFKRGVITDEISQNLQEAISLAKKYMLDAVELRSVWDKNIHELSKDELLKIKRMTAEAGLPVCAISSPFYKCSLHNAKEIQDHLAILQKTVEAAKLLEVPLVRGFTFWAEGEFEENLPLIIKKFEEPLKLLEQEGITLILESDPSVFASNAEKLEQVIRGINSPFVKALWDPGNNIYDPDGEIPYPDGYYIIKPHLAHVHLKDAVKLPDNTVKSVPIGEGDVDYYGQLNALIQSGYDGYVVLETHYRPNYELDEKLFLLPKGSAFSYLGYEATEECLIKWNDLLASIKNDKRQLGGLYVD